MDLNISEDKRETVMAKKTYGNKTTVKRKGKAKPKKLKKNGPSNGDSPRKSMGPSKLRP